MRKSKTHYRIVREGSACGTDGKTSPMRNEVDCKACLKLMKSIVDEPPPKLSLGRMPDLYPTDVVNKALDVLLKRAFLDNSDELRVAVETLKATAIQHREAFKQRVSQEDTRARFTHEEYEELLGAIVPVIRALGVELDGKEKGDGAH